MQGKIALVAEENFPAGGREGEELAEGAGQQHGKIRGVIRLRRSFRRRPVRRLEVRAVLVPGCMPFCGAALREALENFLRPVDAKIMGHRVGRSEVSEAAGAEDRDFVERVEIAQSEGDNDDHAVTFAGDAAEQVENFAFGARVETAGHLVAEEQGWFAGQFHGEGKAATLPAGEMFRKSLGGGTKAGEVEQLGGPRPECRPGEAGDAEAKGEDDVLLGGEIFLADGELRNVADLRWREVLQVEVDAFPM